MAKVGVINRNERRKRLVENKADLRAELKAKIIDESLSWDERMDARDALNKLPKDSSSVRVRNRCSITGRGRGNYRKFKICRNVFREMASYGKLPGVTKSSW
ncbi:MAG: 30S ribosomal protein S14 [Magnetococcales bacterium]|nr:30S ribosomal protein S14 [Magnetococcales bacterium]|tara:strand:+ start:6658 stop:6963 length:306 start_codon:yes stop_codon:yes gene_type:complete